MRENTTGGLLPRASEPGKASLESTYLTGAVRVRSAESDGASFGPFRLFPRARSLEKDGATLKLGNRALDILIALVERPGEVVSHKELLAQAWRGLVVEPSNLRVHISSLRKALGDTDTSPRYIANVSGRGYCFVAPVQRELGVRPALGPAYERSAARVLDLPPALPRMVGREDAVLTVSEDLIAERFVTVMGPGGMGKTTVALAVAHALLPEFEDAVCFIDVDAVSDSSVLVTTIASALGLMVQTEDVLPTLLACLRSLRILLVLDNCEHVIDAAATFAELVYKQVPGVHILATSREALRVEGEHLYWLPPLASPAPGSSLKAADVLAFPAIKLFLERAAAGGTRFDLSDADAPVVAAICGRLDGIALAIELAAGRAASHGIAGTAELLEKGLGLNWQGRRTAHPRHQTLQALLDWSYDSLTECEQTVFRRLSVFIGAFTLDAASAIVSSEPGALVVAGHSGQIGADVGPEIDAERVADTLDRLVAKSLLSTAAAGEANAGYRLLETTRVYAGKRLAQCGEAEIIARRHAGYFAWHLDELFEGRTDSAQDERLPSFAVHLGNVRAALTWCFAASSERPLDTERARLAFDLAASSTPLFLSASLLSECYQWSGEALALLGDETRGSKQEMVLQETRAISAIWTRGNVEEVRTAVERGIEIARRRGAGLNLLRLLVGRQMFLLRIGDFRGSRLAAEDLGAVAQTHWQESFGVVANWLRGASEHFMGNQRAAQQHFERGFAAPGPRNVEIFGLDHRVRALVPYARVLWLRGRPKRAIEVANEAISEAARLSVPVNVCFSLLYTAPVFLWCGDHAAANTVLENVVAHPNWKALPSFHATGLALQGEILVRSGDPARGIALLESALVAMKAERQAILLGRTVCALAEGLTALGRLDEALATIEDAIPQAPVGNEPLDLPEMLRIKAAVLIEIGRDESAVENCLEQSMASARRQSAMSWELRTATTLAQFRALHESREHARQLLASIYDRFTDGFETSDLATAKRLLSELS